MKKFLNDVPTFDEYVLFMICKTKCNNTLKLTTMEKMIKNLTEKRVCNTAFARAKEYDFTDDGSRFIGWTYKTILPITICRHENMTYLSIRVDYMIGKMLKAPYAMWRKQPEYKLCDKYNSCVEFSLAELARDCDAILDAIERTNFECATMNIDTRDTSAYLAKRIVEKREVINLAKSKIDLWTLGVQSYNVSHVIGYVRSLSNNIESMNNELITLESPNTDNFKRVEIVLKYENRKDSNFYETEIMNFMKDRNLI